MCYENRTSAGVIDSLKSRKFSLDKLSAHVIFSNQRRRRKPKTQKNLFAQKILTVFKMTENPIKRLFRNLFSLLSVRSFDYVYTFSVMVILTRYFGPELYGDYAFIVSIVFIYIPLINFGITPLMVRELATRTGEQGDIFGAGLTFRVILATLAIVGTTAILPFLQMSRELALALVICLAGEICLLGSAHLRRGVHRL